MDTPEEKNGGSPDKIGPVLQQVNETLNQVKQIDRQIAAMPKDAKPAPAPRPLGWFNNQKHPGNRDRNIAFLKSEQERLTTDAFGAIETVTRDADSKTRRAVRDSVRERLFPNPYRQMSQEERSQERHAVKDLDHSQDFVDTMLRAGTAGRSHGPALDNQAAENPDRNAPSASEQFSKSLRFRQMMENERDVSRPILPPEPEMD